MQNSQSLDRKKSLGRNNSQRRKSVVIMFENEYEEKVVSLPRPQFNQPPPKKYGKICLCLGFLIILVGGLVAFALYIASAPKGVWNGITNLSPPGAIDTSVCPCGYTDSQTGAHYNFATEIDFTKVPDFNGQGFFKALNRIVPLNETTGSYGKQFDPAQVSVVPQGLSLTVTYTPGSENIKGAQLESFAQNILFGTFRVVMQLPTIPGTCASLFWFLDNTQEIDMEFLSSSTRKNRAPYSYYGTQTGQENQVDNPNAWKETPTVASQTNSFNEYRFDWSSTKVDYFLNGIKMQTSTEGVPQNPGLVVMNHWSTGAIGWEAVRCRGC
ncbi:hypothetical protein HDU91_000532 [Kappamyces sp. JEL0680]|nr:hypothetical protein HDU91_000532 [Kappamyces sp. JEL0680]